MSEQKPRIVSLRPVVLKDNRRVTLELIVDNLPDTTANVNFFMPDMAPDRPPQPSPHADPDTPSPYPDVELSILNPDGQKAASLFIVEHKEKHSALTLHLPAPDLAGQYKARAEIIYQDEPLDIVETPFRLGPMDD